MSSIVATNALAVTSPTPGAVVRRAAIGSAFAKAAIRASATAIGAVRGANTANSGASSGVNVGDRSRSAIRVGTHALLLGGTRSPSRRTSAFASAMYRVRVRTSASRTANSARAIGVQRRLVRVRHDHRVAQRLQGARHPLALGARLAQDPARRPLTEHGREPLPAGGDPTVAERAVVRLDGPRTLALVQIQAP